MRSILSLFGRSPFAPIKSHMESVAKCVHKLSELFEAVDKEDEAAQNKIADEISTLEHQADLIKNDIRNHLPKSLFLPVDRGSLLDILTLQDSIADKAEDLAVLATLKPIRLLLDFRAIFFEFLNKNIEAYNGAHLIIKELHDLLESSFGGIEAEKVRFMVEEVAYKEHEADMIQRKLLKDFFQAEDEMKYSAFHQWQKIFEALGAISNLSENLSEKVRMTLEIK